MLFDTEKEAVDYAREHQLVIEDINIVEYGVEVEFRGERNIHRVQEETSDTSVWGVGAVMCNGGLLYVSDVAKVREHFKIDKKKVKKTTFNSRLALLMTKEKADMVALNMTRNGTYLWESIKLK